MQPFFENVSKKNQNFKKIKIEVLISRSVFKLEKKTKKIQAAEKTAYENIKIYSTRFFKACRIFEHFVFELSQIHEGCFEYRFMSLSVIYDDRFYKVFCVFDLKINFTYKMNRQMLTTFILCKSYASLGFHIINQKYKDICM